MINIEYENYGEVRMGSPIIVSEIKVHGSPWQPKLFSEHFFQKDLNATKDDRWVFLLRWDYDDATNFRGYLIDIQDRKILMTNLIHLFPFDAEIVDSSHVKLNVEKFYPEHGTRFSFALSEWLEAPAECY